MSSEKQTVRSFRKHKTFGEVWAVLTLPGDKPAITGGCRCAKPEEQTRGALPVLVMDMSPEVIEFLEDNAADMEVWEPPYVPAERLDVIVAAGRIAEAAEALMKQKKTAYDAAKKEWEGAAQELQRLVHEAAEEKAATPLFD